MELVEITRNVQETAFIIAYATSMLSMLAILIFQKDPRVVKVSKAVGGSIITAGILIVAVAGVMRVWL